MFVDGTVVFSRRPHDVRRRTAAFVGKLLSKRTGWTFEVGVRRFDGRIVWISGPYPSRRPDITIFRSGGLIRRLKIGERICGDKGYASKDLEKIILTPAKKPAKRDLSLNAVYSNIRNNFQREIVEHAFARLKKFRCVGSVWRGHDLVFLRRTFFVCCALTNIDLSRNPIHKTNNV
jgi:hypothetical protein